MTKKPFRMEISAHAIKNFWNFITHRSEKPTKIEFDKSVDEKVDTARRNFFMGLSSRSSKF